MNQIKTELDDSGWIGNSAKSSKRYQRHSFRISIQYQFHCVFVLVHSATWFMYVCILYTAKLVDDMIDAVD